MAAVFYLFGRQGSQYTAEESVPSPDGKFVVTRFREATPFVVCNEVVVVMPVSVPFDTRSVEKYIRYSALSVDCALEVRVRWSGNSTLEISSSANDSEAIAAERWKRSPLGNQVTLSFRRTDKLPPGRSPS